MSNNGDARSKYLMGDDIYLTGIQESDLGGVMFDWFNDSEVTHYMYYGVFPNTIDTMSKYFIEQPDSVTLLVFEKSSDKLIGITGLYHLNWIARSAEFRILIGDKDVWGKGYATQSTVIMNEYAFQKLNLNKVWLGANVDNAAAIRVYEKCGFVKEGILRQEIYRNGKYYDAIRMSILKDEYSA